MRHFSLFDEPEDKKTAATPEENEYYTFDLDSSEFRGVYYLLLASSSDPELRNRVGDQIDDLLAYIDSGQITHEHTLRLNGKEFALLYDLFYVFQHSDEDFIEANPNLDIEDIFNAEEKIMGQVQKEPSSAQGLEEIPATAPEPDHTGILPPATWAGQQGVATQPAPQPPAAPDELEALYNKPATQHPLGPNYGSAGPREVYTNGSFVKGPNGWLVAISPAGGQRPPQPGDWANMVQRTRAFNRPVPVTLIEDLGGAWKFRNGHHPDISNQIQE